MKNLFENVNWGKVAEKAGYAVAILVAISGAISDQKKENEFNQLKKDVARLKGEES